MHTINSAARLLGNTEGGRAFMCVFVGVVVFVVFSRVQLRELTGKAVAKTKENCAPSGVGNFRVERLDLP